MQVKVYSVTDKGRIRAHNEDACFTHVGETLSFGIVCDGMGGANAGEVASAMAQETFASVLFAGGYPMEELMRQALEQANREVYCHGWEHPECRGMGTTLVAAVVFQSTAYILNVGDSRAYSIQDQGIRQITEDHSLVGDLLRAGAITPEQAKHHPRRNIITRALGTERNVTGDLFIRKLVPGETILLCSDGLTNELSDQEILELVRQAGSVEAGCRDLLEAALENGARDNVTAVLMELQDNTER